tara:strand:+ start:611 stop:811 length:201 start_codon:yes stop_codon:yes gene_type:complete
LRNTQKNIDPSKTKTVSRDEVHKLIEKYKDKPQYSNYDPPTEYKKSKSIERVIYINGIIVDLLSNT